MSKIRLHGSTSGYKDLVVPAVSDNAEVNIGNFVSNNSLNTRLGGFTSNNSLNTRLGGFTSNNSLNTRLGGFVSNNFFQDNSAATGSLYEFYTGLADTHIDGNTGNQVLKYNTLSYSEGTPGYNTSTGYWTAATAGIYMFNWVMIFKLSAGGGWGYKNGYLFNSTEFITEAVTSDNAHNEYNSSGKIRHSGTAILKMAVSNTFRVFHQSGYNSTGGSFESSGSTLQILRMT